MNIKTRPLVQHTIFSGASRIGLPVHLVANYFVTSHRYVNDVMSNGHSTFSTINISAHTVTTNTTTPCLCWCDTRSGLASLLSCCCCCCCCALLIGTAADSLPLTSLLYAPICLSVCLCVCVCVSVDCVGVSGSKRLDSSVITDRPAIWLWWRHSPDESLWTSHRSRSRCHNQEWIETNLIGDKKERFKCESTAVKNRNQSRIKL